MCCRTGLALLGSLFPPAKQRGLPLVDRRHVVEAVIWRFRTGAYVTGDENPLPDEQGRLDRFQNGVI